VEVVAERIRYGPQVVGVNHSDQDVSAWKRLHDRLPVGMNDEFDCREMNLPLRFALMTIVSSPHMNFISPVQ
jgi:hypothetical protein